MTSWHCPLCDQDVPVRTRWDKSQVIHHVCPGLGRDGLVEFTETSIDRLAVVAAAVLALMVAFGLALWLGSR